MPPNLFLHFENRHIIVHVYYAQIKPIQSLEIVYNCSWKQMVSTTQPIGLTSSRLFCTRAVLSNFYVYFMGLFHRFRVGNFVDKLCQIIKENVQFSRVFFDVCCCRINKTINKKKQIKLMLFESRIRFAGLKWFLDLHGGHCRITLCVTRFLREQSSWCPMFVLNLSGAKQTPPSPFDDSHTEDCKTRFSHGCVFRTIYNCYIDF